MTDNDAQRATTDLGASVRSLLDRLFATHAVERRADGTLHGRASTRAGTAIGLVGITDQTPLGVEAALSIAGDVLAHVRAGGGVPLIVLASTSSQRMTRRDELLGLNEHLAHLAKSLTLASLRAHRTIGLLHGPAAAGAFIATALATDILVALPGAAPSVMDLKSVARVTKLPEDRLRDMARATPIFAPGVEALAATGAITETWSDDDAFDHRLDALLDGAPGATDRRDAPGATDRRDSPGATDRRDALGAERGGRTRAAAIARRVQDAVAGRIAG